MLFVFLALYVALGIACIVLGRARRKRSSVTCGIVTLVLAMVSLGVWVLYSLGASHWTVTVLQALLSPMPESLLEPAPLQDATQDGGVPYVLFAILELLIAIMLWAIPGLGLVTAGRAPRIADSTR